MAIGDKLFVADKPTLDQINTKIDQIKTSVDSVNSSSPAIAFKPPIRFLNQTTTPPTSGYTTLLNITGRGQVIRIIAQLSIAGGASGGTGTIILRVTFDGKTHEISSSKTIAASSSSGVTANYVIGEIAGGSTIENGMFDPLKFNQNFRVEISSTLTGTATLSPAGTGNGYDVVYRTEM